MTCYFVSALASVAASAPDSLEVGPVLPEMKMQQGLVDKIAYGTLMPRRFQAIFCPGEASNESEGLDLVNDIRTRLGQREGNGGRHLIANHFLRSGGIETRDDERAAFWSRALQTNIDANQCQDLLDTLQIEVSDTADSFSFESTIQETDETVRNCLLLLVTGIATQPEACWIGDMPDVSPLNAEAQWITQSRTNNSRPFFDVGLDGTGQIISLADTGIDTDNCYFWDESGEVPKDGVSQDKCERPIALTVLLMLQRTYMVHILLS